MRFGWRVRSAGTYGCGSNGLGHCQIVHASQSSGQHHTVGEHGSGGGPVGDDVVQQDASGPVAVTASGEADMIVSPCFEITVLACSKIRPKLVWIS